jgi:hypothetical protein
MVRLGAHGFGSSSASAAFDVSSLTWTPGRLALSRTRWLLVAIMLGVALCTGYWSHRQGVAATEAALDLAAPSKMISRVTSATIPASPIGPMTFNASRRVSAFRC